MARAFDSFNELLLRYGDLELQEYRQKSNDNLSTAIKRLYENGIPLSPPELLAQIEEAEREKITELYRKRGTRS